MIKKIKFKYYLEDCACIYCMYFKRSGKTRKKRCSIADLPCCCGDYKKEAVLNERITREPENKKCGVKS